MSNFNEDTYQSAKRAMDIICSVFFLLIFSPIYFATVIAIYLQDRGSPIYVQKRVGKGKREFDFIKFRSMIKNADEVLFSNKSLYKKMRSGTHKVKDDPRVTRVGKFIRKYSIDELPQFVNVLKGEMSFVGPRALRPDELAKFEKEHPEMRKYINDIFKVKPGITGLWQVSGRSKIPFNDRVEMDANYSNTPSLITDILIILKTPLAVLRGEGTQ